MAKAKTAAPKKASVKKAPASKTPAKTATPKAAKEAFTKTALLNHIAEETGLSKKDVGAVLDSLKGAIHSHIRKGAVGTFTLPGLLKIKTQKIPARKAQKGVPNPFKPGETMDVAARPASIKTKVLPLKALKDMAN
ncbi:MAG TPA: HU family DNA-binding protein [Pseudomonadales bacterium]